MCLLNLMVQTFSVARTLLIIAGKTLNFVIFTYEIPNHYVKTQQKLLKLVLAVNTEFQSINLIILYNNAILVSSSPCIVLSPTFSSWFLVSNVTSVPEANALIAVLCWTIRGC